MKLDSSNKPLWLITLELAMNRRSYMVFTSDEAIEQVHTLRSVQGDISITFERPDGNKMCCLISYDEALVWYQDKDYLNKSIGHLFPINPDYTGTENGNAIDLFNPYAQGSFTPRTAVLSKSVALNILEDYVRKGQLADWVLWKPLKVDW